MKNVLFIAYLFPPRGGGGVQRTVKFVKYLPHFGWQATVITSPVPGPVQDPSLVDDDPNETRVVQVRGIELPKWMPWRVRRSLTSWMLAVDAQIGWFPFATRQGLILLRQEDFTSIYSTSAPYTDHLVALQLKRQSGLPWVADFRDPWTENPLMRCPTRWHCRLNERLENTVVTSADRVLVVSEPMRRQFLRRYAHLSPEHFVTLPNGYDQGDFVDVSPKELDATCFNLVYTGSLYGRRSARLLLAAIHCALDEGQLDRERLCLWMVGATGKETARLVDAWNLTDVVTLLDYVPHREAIGYQLGADALVLIIGSGPGSELVLTGKLFEYLAAGKPVLALVPPGAASDLVTESRVGRVADPDDVSAIAEEVVRLYHEWRTGRLQVHPNSGVVKRYERRRLTEQLARVFDELGKHTI